MANPTTPIANIPGAIHIGADNDPHLKTYSPDGVAATIVNGGDVAEGSTTDAKVTGDNPGTVIAFLRGLSTIFASVWDSINSRLKVDGSGVTQPISSVALDLAQGADATSATGPLVQARVSDGDEMWDTDTVRPMLVDRQGNLRVTVAAGEGWSWDLNPDLLSPSDGPFFSDSIEFPF